MASDSNEDSDNKEKVNELFTSLSQSSNDYSEPSNQSQLEVATGDTVEKCRHEGWKQGLCDVLAVLESVEVRDIRMDSKLTNAEDGINDSIRLNVDKFVADQKIPVAISFAGDWKTGYTHAIQHVNHRLRAHRDPEAKDTWGKFGGERGKLEGIKVGLQRMIRAAACLDYYLSLKEWLFSQSLESLRKKEKEFKDEDYIAQLEIDLGDGEHMSVFGRTSGRDNRLKLVNLIHGWVVNRENWQKEKV